MATPTDSRLGETLVFAALSNAANLGEPCPTNEDLSEMLGDALGWTALSTPPGIVARLERSGLIRVERYQRERRVTIVGTGKQTAAVRTPAVHWRNRPRETRPPGAGHIPAPAVGLVRDRRPDTAHDIFAAAQRLGRAPADFLADLVWLGWQAFRTEAIQRDPTMDQG